MKSEVFSYYYKEKEYKVFLVRGGVRNINYRVNKNGLRISAPYLVSKKKIIEGLNKFAPQLLNSYVKKSTFYNFNSDYVFLLGEKYSLKDLNIFDEDQLNIILKKRCLEVLTILTRKYEQIMNIDKPYKIRIKSTTSRYGSNSCKTHSITYQLDLIHFSEDIISTVVVHELAHEYYRNHQENFYNLVYSYCPNYNLLQKKLKKGITK